MGRRVRGESFGPAATIGVILYIYGPALLFLLVLTFPTLASARSSNKAEFRLNRDSRNVELLKNFMQVVGDRVYTFGRDAEELLRNTCGRVAEGRWGLSELAWGGALICAIQGVILWRMTAAASRQEIKHKGREIVDDRPLSLWASWNINPEMEAETSDPGLLQKFSSFRKYETSRATYPSIRTFYRPHSQANKLPNKPTPLPLLVFVHGLGGCLASFTPILTSLINIAPCLGIDFPGCGRSAFSPTSWDAYTPEALSQLLCTVIEQHVSREESQGVIFIGHSMGCSLSLLAATSFNENQHVEVLSLIGVCPAAGPPSGKMATTYDRLLRIPTWIFDIMRTLDRRKGLKSPSVTQFTGKDADLELRRIQMKYNRQSRTPVFRRMARGALPLSSGSISSSTTLPGLEIWSRLKVPVFLIAGEGDTVTKPDEVAQIAQAMGKTKPPTFETNQSIIEQDQTPVGRLDSSNLAREKQSTVSNTEVIVLNGIQHSQSQDQLTNGSASYSRKRRVLKTTILPYPASHALLYGPSTYRTLAGLIQTFLSDHVDTRLSLGWQLQHLSTEGKWDVKNLAKWQAIQPVSPPIAGIFRAMKTLREIDDVHSPKNFVTQWKGKIKAVIDISHESPVYDPKGLEEGGIEYHKFPTVSKIPPTGDETKEFIKLVDRIREETSDSPSDRDNLIGVHCHYGFNRTGFFICCYLIESENYTVQQAIDTFAEGRPKGIKHAHFLDQLFVRYCVGLKRAPTM